MIQIKPSNHHHQQRFIIYIITKNQSQIRKNLHLYIDKIYHIPQKRKIDRSANEEPQPQPQQNDIVMQDLSEEMKEALKMSMDDTETTNTTTTNNESKQKEANNTSKEESFECLTVMYILQIRHEDLTAYHQHIGLIKDFRQYINNDNVLSGYCMVDEETPISSSTIEAIFIDRFQKEFAVYKSSFKYLIKCYERCEEFVKRINEHWTYIIPKENQLQIIQNIQQCIITFCGILVSTPDLTTMDDFLKSQQEFQHILVSPVGNRTFPKGFLSSSVYFIYFHLFEHITTT